MNEIVKRAIVINVWEGGGVIGKEIQGRKRVFKEELAEDWRGASSGETKGGKPEEGVNSGMERRWETQRMKRNWKMEIGLWTKAGGI